MNTPRQEIWNFVLDTHEQLQHIEAPYIVQVLDIQRQETQVVMWAVVYPDSAARKYVILRFLTGDTVVGAESYLGTVQLESGDVLHYFSGGPGL